MTLLAGWLAAAPIIKLELLGVMAGQHVVVGQEFSTAPRGTTSDVVADNENFLTLRRVRTPLVGEVI